MQFTDAFCYALLTITMTATCIEAEGKKLELEVQKSDRRLSRGDATVIIDNMPIIDRAVHKPKVIYRRISKQKYGPKPKYGPPRSKYGPPKASRKPNKKYRGKISPKYGSPGQKKRAPKPRFGLPKKPVISPMYGTAKKKKISPSFLSNSYHPEPMGFAEPPSFDNNRSPKPDYDDFQKQVYEDYQKPSFGVFYKAGFPSSIDFYKPGSSGFNKPTFGDFHKPKFNDFQKLSFDGFRNPISDDYPPNNGYGEPPVDSYGAPIKSNLHDLTYSTSQSYSDTPSNHDQDSFSSTLQSWKSYHQEKEPDSKYAFSKQNVYIKPENDVYVTPMPEDNEEELGLNSYSDIYNFRQMKNQVKKKPYQNLKIIRKPWVGMKEESEVIVGGQYAEPPARYVPKVTQTGAPIFPENTDFGPLGDLSDPEMIVSATNSPYVNYKNSNMAFSPQNLNDAFSIVD